MLTFRLQREDFQPERTIGRVYVDGEPMFYSMEDTDRALYGCMTEKEVRAIKVKGKTAIPYGAYRVGFQMSPRFGRQMLSVFGTVGFEGIRIHAGNTEKDTEGCLLFGMSKTKTSILQSKIAIEKAEKLVRDAGGEAILLIC